MNPSPDRLAIGPADAAAVVLAGGFGTRLARVIKDIPKPMVPAAGRPFVEWIVRFLGNSGISRVVLCTGHLAHVVEDHFRAGVVPGVEVTCVRETTTLGTGGAFLNAVAEGGFAPAAWLVCNGDSLILESLELLFRELNVRHADAALIGRRMHDAHRFGTLGLGEDELLRSFSEKQPSSGPSLINAGVYLFKNELLARFPQRRPASFEYDVFPQLLSLGARIAIHASDGPFLDIGTEETLPQADEFVTGHHSWFGG